MSTPLEKLNFESFREQLHSPFAVQLDHNHQVSLELVAAVEGKTTPKMELFSLYFRGPFTPRLNQQIHALQHERLGTLEIFLTPVDADPVNGTTYETVFHRFRKT